VEVPFEHSVADDGKTLIENRDEQAVLRFVRERRANGDTIRAIVADCEWRGLASRVGRPFGLTQVARMLGGSR
jgi:hypothetical protein